MVKSGFTVLIPNDSAVIPRRLYRRTYMSKIEIFGDSILKGVMYLEEAGRYKLFGGKLEERFALLGTNVKRYCHMGDTIDTGLERLRRTLDKAEASGDVRGSTVLLEFGGNDCAYDWKAVSAAPDAVHEPNTSLEKFIRLYDEAIDCARSYGANVAVSSLIPIDAVKYMNYISRGLSYDNILSWLGDVSMLYRWHEGYNRAVEYIADKKNCPLVDLRGRFLMAHNFPELICADGMHPTAAGHQLIEDSLVGCLA